MMSKKPLTYESEVLGILAYEFPFSKKEEAENKIKKRLKSKKLGPYDPKRISVLRLLKDNLQQEVSKHEKSRYFTSYHGKYADMQDFDVPQLTKDFVARHPQIPKEEVENFVTFSIFLYYLR
jgi:hypothetical protein